MASYLITGTSRGLGLEMVKQLLQAPASQVSKVFAVTRNTKSSQLTDVVNQSGGRAVNIVIDDISNEESAAKVVPQVEAALGGKGLDVLINNAGAASYQPNGMSAVTSKQLLDLFNVNVVSAQVITATFLPLLEKGSLKKVMNISTSFGSLAWVKHYAFAPTQAYKISKAAMNMLNAQYAIEFADKGFTFLLITPGWVKTDLGSEFGHLEPDVAVKAVLELVFKADKSMNGQFRNVKVAGWDTPSDDPRGLYDGAVIPW